MLPEFELHKGETYPALALVILFFCLFFILKIKRFLSYDIASMFDMLINIKERIDVNQDGPV